MSAETSSSTQAELRETIAVMDLVMAAMAEAIVVTSKNGRIRYANDRFAQMTGRPRIFLLGLCLWDILPELRGIWTGLSAREGARPASKWDGVSLRLPQGLRYCDIFVSTLSGKIIAVMHDVTERKDLAEKLIQSEKLRAVGTLAAGVAHEINNPLGVILGFAQGVAQRVKEGDAFYMPLKSIEREALRCKKLVQDLLHFSRQQEACMRPIDVSAVIEEALSIVKTQLKMKSIELIQELSSAGRIQGDERHIQQIVINLCGNAIDAMPHGGKLSVRTSDQAKDGRQWVVLEIEDSGTGIPEAIRDKVFEPFFTTKGPGKGTGLGLALARESVLKHGGNIQFKSEPSKGTKFTIYLPLA